MRFIGVVSPGRTPQLARFCSRIGRTLIPAGYLQVVFVCILKNLCPIHKASLSCGKVDTVNDMI